MKKRSHKRINCKASITYSCFNKDHSYKARVLNFSKQGMYFESDHFFKEGTSIYYKIKNCKLDSADIKIHNIPRMTSLAEVKWWKQIGDKDSLYFGVGVKYYR